MWETIQSRFVHAVTEKIFSIFAVFLLFSATNECVNTNDFRVLKR